MARFFPSAIKKIPGGHETLFFLLLIGVSVLLLPVLAYPNGTETIITTGTAGSVQQAPSIFNSRIVWDDQRLGPGMNTIYAYDLFTGFEYPVLPDPSNSLLWQTGPSVHGDWVVWQQDDGSAYTIVAFNNASLETIPIPAVPRDQGWYSYFTEAGDNVLPRTNGTAVVWQDYTNNPSWGVYLYDLTRGSSGTPDPILADPAYDQKKPAISGDYVVYENWSGGQSDIYLWFGGNRTAVQISQFANDDLNPAIDGTRIVWQRNNETTGHDAIYLYDITTGRTRQLTPAGSLFDQRDAKIDGDLVVVQDYRDTYEQVYAYRLTTNPPAEIWVTPASAGDKTRPAVSGNRIVWEDYRIEGGSDADIYLTTLGPAEVCPVADFTVTPSAVDSGDTVTFSARGAQTGASAITHHAWNFRDGSPGVLSGGAIATHQFTGDGAYLVNLTVGNPKCRNVSVDTCSHRAFVNSPPVANFSAVPEYGLRPLNVHFTDTSCGAPLTRAWDFGDGNTSAAQNPVNIFYSPGREYTVTLTVNNTRAGYATSTITRTIRTFMGEQNTAALPVYGIVVDGRYGGGFLTYNSTAVPEYSPEPRAPYLAAYPPQEYGWANITFIASESEETSPASPNETYFTNISRVYLTTQDVIATTSGTPPPIGTNWGANYQVNTTVYPASAQLHTEVWEGATLPDRLDFEFTGTHAATPLLIRRVAYTARITRQGFSREGDEKINLSVGHSWVLSAGNLYLFGSGTDPAGNKTGAVIPLRHLFQAGDLDYYEAVIPEAGTFLTTFALADVSGSYNPFQLITLSVTTHIEPAPPNGNPSPGSESDNAGKGGGAGAAKITVATTATPAPAPAPADPGTSAKVYTNPQGRVSQATKLLSTDGMATVTLDEGIVAMDAGGKPLSEITIKATPAGDLPAVPSGSAFTFAGMAYEIGPDGATFSPPLTLTFRIPEAQWSRDYTVRSFDRKTGTWQTLPTTFDAATGTVTVQVSHLCCFALFTKASASPGTPVPTPLPVAVAPQVTAQPPASAVSIFMDMIEEAVTLVLKNAVILIAIIFLAIAAILVKRGRSPGFGR